MKANYIYTTEVRKCKYANIVTANIYKIENNIPTYVCEHKFNTGSCKGYASEVFTALYHAGEISENRYNHDNGYYINREDSDIQIFSI